MADADVQITAGSGTKVDTRTVGAGTDEHRQVVVIGDPTTAANVAAVSADGHVLVKVWDTVSVHITDSEAELEVKGDLAHDAVDSGSNPVKIGGVYKATPTAVASGDRTDILTDAHGHLLQLPHETGFTPLSIAVAVTAQQTSANIIAGTGGQRIYVPNLTIAVGGTTGGRVSIYWGTGAFTGGTSVTLFDGEFAPSTTAKPGAVLNFQVPMGGASATGDNLRITTSAAMTVYVSGQAYKA